MIFNRNFLVIFWPLDTAHRENKFCEIHNTWPNLEN